MQHIWEVMLIFTLISQAVCFVLLDGHCGYLLQVPGLQKSAGKLANFQRGSGICGSSSKTLPRSLHVLWCYFIFTSKPKIYFHSIENLFFCPVSAIANSCVLDENACSIMLYFKSIFFFKMTLMCLSLLFLQHENTLPFSWVIHKHLLSVIKSRFLYLSWLVIYNYTLSLLELWL